MNKKWRLILFLMFALTFALSSCFPFWPGGPGRGVPGPGGPGHGLPMPPHP